MKPSEVRARFLEDHVVIRDMLISLESLARQVLEEQHSRWTPLREEAELLLVHLQEHMRWEDVHLSAALMAGDRDAQQRAQVLKEEHVEQRELLGHAVERMRDPERPDTLVAENVIDLIELLRDDIRDEEENLLDALMTAPGAV